jgi:hypothetical protein
MIAHMVTNVVVYAIPYMIFMIISMVDEDTKDVYSIRKWVST